MISFLLIVQILVAYEEFPTLLYQLKAILNFRSVYAMSSNPSNLEPLILYHFPIHRPTTLLSDYNLYMRESINIFCSSVMKKLYFY